MRPSPFTGKFKKRQLKIQKDKTQERQQERQQETQPDVPKQTNNNNLKLPSSRNIMKLPRSIEKQKTIQVKKQTKKIEEDVPKDLQQGQRFQSKASASFKPNLKLKAGKKIKLSTNQQQTQQVRKQQQPEQPQIYRPVKPSLFRKAENPINSQRNINRQEILIQQQPKNRNIEQDSYEGTVTQSMSIAPKFKIKQKQQTNFPIIQEQKMQQTAFGVNNFADLKIQTRQINLEPSENNVSQVKISKQKARVRQLTKLLNLQVDLYEQTLNVSCVTPYEIYINKIKSGSLINSNDQAFDQKTHAGCQTATLQFQDFTNQCPQDYHNDVMSITQREQTQVYNQFVAKIAPVFQELIKPSNTVVMPPIFLLALRPDFKKLITCPFPVFVYHSSSLNLGIIVIGQKLYIAQNQILSVLSIGSNLVAGSKDGTIYIWTGKNDKRSRIYNKIKQNTQSTNFELPEHSSQQLDRFSIFRTWSPIVSLNYQSNDEFTSLDSNCKMTKWKIQKNSNNNSIFIQPYISYEFASMIQRQNLIGYNIKKRNQIYFICSSAGILVWNNEEILQRLDTQGFKVVGLALPNRTNFIYCVCEDSSVRIYQEHYSNQLFKVHLAGASLVDIFIPQVQYQNKKIPITSKIYITTLQGNIYTMDLLKSTTESKILLGGSQKKERDVIFKGVNKLSNGFELVTLWRDLKCTSSLKKFDVNIEPNVANIKNILQENRQIHNWLEAQNSLTIIQ